MALTLEDVLIARQRLSGGLVQTPVMHSAELNALAGAELFFKCEQLQMTGSFKARGALNAVRSLPDNVAQHGVATHSSGNHGAALAWAATSRGIPAHIVVPENAPPIKKSNIRQQGGIIIECESNLHAREATLASVVAKTGAHYVPPYDDARIIAGQGTASLELMAAVDQLDDIITPVGGGGLLAGTLVAMPGRLRVYGAEPSMADDAYRSFTTGNRVLSHSPKTIADGLQTTLGALNFEIIRQQCAGILLVSEEEILAAMALIVTKLDQVVEPSSAVTLAAVLRYPKTFSERRVGLILTGGNLSTSAH